MNIVYPWLKVDPRTRDRDLLQSRWVRTETPGSVDLCVFASHAHRNSWTALESWDSFLYPNLNHLKMKSDYNAPFPHPQVFQKLFFIFLPSCCDFASSHQGLFPNKDEESCYWYRKIPVCKETEAGRFRTMNLPPHELERQPSWETFYREKNWRKRKRKRIEISILKLSFFTSLCCSIFFKWHLIFMT